MKKLIYLIFTSLVIGLVYWWFAGRTPHYKNLPPTAMGSWVAFGDSLTAGYGAEPGQDYPTVLGQKLGLKIENQGALGNTTQDGLNRIGPVAQMHPRVVLVCLGGNDGLQELPRDRMFDNLSEIIDRFQEEGSFVVLIGIRSTTLRDKNKSGFKELAAKKHVFLIEDMLDGVIGQPGLMSDYVHPNGDGYKVIAERIANELQPLLPQLR